MLYTRWASAILQHWKESPLRNYPFTKNRDIAEKLYSDMIDLEMRFNHCSLAEAELHLREWKSIYLKDALNPANFTLINEQLKNY